MLNVKWSQIPECFCEHSLFLKLATDFLKPPTNPLRAATVPNSRRKDSHSNYVVVAGGRLFLNKGIMGDIISLLYLGTRQTANLSCICLQNSCMQRINTRFLLTFHLSRYISREQASVLSIASLFKPQQLHTLFLSTKVLPLCAHMMPPNGLFLLC